ncbi:MAG: dethiobiotin synthase [Candidatus Thiodiazotropha lotti]|nr:dethiobiotin synthase [Candidatus Thiodiazotropha lotti]MCG7997962.1 dethiobiotin synthase [Candidatus Thiodiazotropha lotti]MCW4185183.1 dethiobiotin synthase [Candidatus Thiodiazotropha weberae]MCW4189725.1 dethiobiotin synthase [Candidatus Thiodiazotropha weberae]
MAGLFITGTDTGCGKTEVTLGLMHRLQQQGKQVVGMKPIASGAADSDQGLCNEDALRIQAQASLELPYQLVNPFVFQPAIAPHLAALQAGKSIDIAEIVDGYQSLSEEAEHVLVEGVGGWHVPLGEQDTLADLARALELPVVMVVGMRLGCLNHALMTTECMLNAGVSFAGWVANQVEPEMSAREENLATLRTWLPAPCLGEIPYLEETNPEVVAGYLSDALCDLTGLSVDPCVQD